MEILKIVLTVLALVVAVYTISKKTYAPTALLACSFVILLIHAIVTGESVMGDATSGSWFLDIFEFMRKTLVDQFVGLGMNLIPIMGYSAFMTEIKASQMMTVLCTRPLKKIKNPYVVLAITVVLMAVLMIAMPSQTGLTALMLGTLYPILLSLGVSKVAAVSAILLGGCMDLGPAAVDPIFALGAVGSEMSMAEYFVQVQIPCLVVPMLVGAVLCAVVNYKMDKKMEKKLGKAIADQEAVKEAEMPDVPKYYALFPLLPIVFILIFSKLVISSIIISICGAILISWAIILVIDSIRSKSIFKAFDHSKSLFVGMGNGFVAIMPIVVAATVFSSALQKIGGIAVISEWLGATSLPVWLILLLIGLVSLIITVCIGVSQAPISAFTGAITQFAAQSGLLAHIAVFPVQITMGLGRGLSPLSAPVNVAASSGNVNALDLIKRNVIPAAVTWLLASALWAIVLL